MTIPELNFAGLTLFLRKYRINGSCQIVQIAQSIGAPGQGDRALGVGPQRNAGDAQVGGFFLNAARIRQREAAVEYQVHEAHVVQGIE